MPLRMTVFACALAAAPACAQDEPWIQPKFSPRQQEALRAMQRPVTADFLEVPLADAIEALRRQAGLGEVWLDRRALEEAGVSPQRNVTFSAHQEALRTVLHFILRELELTWTFLDDVVLITTREKADSALLTRTYDVTDLVLWAGGAPDFDSLIDLLTSIVQPQSWDEVGGPGSIEPFRMPDRRRYLIVLSQTLDVLEEVESLLRVLKQYHGSPALASTLGWDRSRGRGQLAAVSPASRSRASIAPASRRGALSSPPGRGRGRTYAETPDWLNSALKP